MQSEIGSSLRPLNEVTDWRNRYPRLVSHYDIDHLDSELIFLETRFDLLCDYPPSGSQLSVNAFIHVNGGMKYSQWLSSTHLYERGVRITERNNIRWDDHFIDLEATNSSATDMMKIELRLNCRWWASNVFGRILNDVRNAKAQGNEYAMQEAEIAGRRFLEQMSLMQEIWATPRIKDSTPRRVVTLLWKFSQIRDHQEAATTSWRKLRTSNNTNPSVQYPLPSDLDRSMEINPSAQNIVMVQPANSRMDCSPQNNLFVKDAESVIVGQSSNMESALSTSTSDLRFSRSSIRFFQALPSLQDSSYTSRISTH